MMAIASTCVIVLAVRISTLLVHLKKQKRLQAISLQAFKNLI